MFPQDVVERGARIAPALLAALANVAPARLRDAVEHYPRAGGKRLRPAMALFAAEAVGARAADALPYAVAVELVHVFSLVHDDIMDRDLLRRGMPTVHAKWDEPTAILAGDALLAKAFEVIALAERPPERVRAASRVLAHATQVLCEGQALDMEYESQSRGGGMGAHGAVTEAEYLHMIEAKTAALFAAACEGGALLAGADPAEASALADFGRSFGMAFQLRDDLLDYVGTTAMLGKPAGSDLRAGKRSLVALVALERRVAPFTAAFGRADSDDRVLARVVKALADAGVLAEVERRVARETEAALVALAKLPPSDARTTLESLARWAAAREK